MSLLYLTSRLSLFALHVMIRVFAWRAERKFQHEGNAVEAASAAWKAANDGHSSASASMLWALSERERQQAESRWLCWQQRSELLASWRAGLARWSGATLTYLASEIGILVAIHHDTIREAYDLVCYYREGY